MQKGNFVHLFLCLVKKASKWQQATQLPQSSPSSVSSSESVSPKHYASDLNNSKEIGSAGMF